MSVHAHPGDTQPMSDLIAYSRRLDETINALRADQRRAEETLDKLRLAARPTYPTDEQRAGLAEASRRMGDRVPASTHHGDPTPTYAVVVDGAERWLNIRHGAPNDRKGYHLWWFTDEEVEAFLDILKADAWRIEKWWRCDGGISIRVSA
jgi:hypothetical protein